MNENALKMPAMSEKMCIFARNKKERYNYYGIIYCRQNRDGRLDF